jgi:hypothetical protein
MFKNSIPKEKLIAKYRYPFGIESTSLSKITVSEKLAPSVISISPIEIKNESPKI